MYHLVCPECKNKVDLSAFLEIQKDQVIECNHCGITLVVHMVTPEGMLEVDVVDEGK